MVLASASQARSAILSHAGIPHHCEAADLDETLIKRDAIRKGESVEIAVQRLALAKANKVAQNHIGKFVLGCDQILDCENKWYDKPANIDDARIHLHSLRGKTHRLVNGMVIVYNGTMIWTHTETAVLTMRPFSNKFLEEYLVESGESILSSVGAYLLEARGALLFDSVSGDYFTILGLPLLPILSFLREKEIIRS